METFTDNLFSRPGRTMATTKSTKGKAAAKSGLLSS